MDGQAESWTGLNLATRTLGGQQVWTDHRVRDGYRLQHNVLTQHWRVLDNRDVRRGWGGRSTCESLLDQLRPREVRSQFRRHIVLLHGLMRTRQSMSGLARRLQAALSVPTMNVGYASARAGIADHAAALRHVLEDHPARDSFSFVGHSMGNIVVRHLIADLQQDGDPAGLLRRMNAMVMLGPPNQGAAIARRLAATGMFGMITGTAGIELGRRFECLSERLAIPPFPFAIVAGDLSAQRLQNPLVDGAGDFVVSVEEARLPGAEQVITVPRLHSFLMDDEEAQRFTTKFLKSAW